MSSDNSASPEVNSRQAEYQALEERLRALEALVSEISSRAPSSISTIVNTTNTTVFVSSHDGGHDLTGEIEHLNGHVHDMLHDVEGMTEDYGTFKRTLRVFGMLSAVLTAAGFLLTGTNMLAIHFHRKHLDVHQEHLNSHDNHLASLKKTTAILSKYICSENVLETRWKGADDSEIDELTKVCKELGFEIEDPRKIEVPDTETQITGKQSVLDVEDADEVDEVNERGNGTVANPSAIGM